MAHPGLGNGRVSQIMLVEYLDPGLGAPQILKLVIGAGYRQAGIENLNDHIDPFYQIGNLFQGRYKSPYIDKDEYLLECGRYIERNPLRAQIVDDLSQYYFSSYNFYSEDRRDDIITVNPLYEALSNDPAMRKQLYKQYLLQERPYENIIDK